MWVTIATKWHHIPFCHKTKLLAIIGPKCSLLWIPVNRIPVNYKYFIPSEINSVNNIFKQSLVQQVQSELTIFRTNSTLCRGLWVFLNGLCRRVNNVLPRNISWGHRYEPSRGSLGIGHLDAGWCWWLKNFQVSGDSPLPKRLKSNLGSNHECTCKYYRIVDALYLA